MGDLVVRGSATNGRGVFATRPFAKGETIEICPVIPLSAADTAKLDGTHLYNYYFGWGPDNKSGAIALGFGSFYNHSYTPNAVYRKNLADETIDFIALKYIASSEEIFIRYNDPTAGKDGPLWFEIQEAQTE